MIHFAAFIASFVSVVPLKDILSLCSCFHLTDVIPSTSPAPFPRIYCVCFNFLCIELFLFQDLVFALIPTCKLKSCHLLAVRRHVLNMLAGSPLNWRLSVSSASAMLH